MSTRKIREALSETIETCDDYAERCAHAGRLDEARSVRRRADRSREALSELEAIEKAAKVLSDTLAIHSADERAATHELMERIAKEAK